MSAVSCMTWVKKGVAKSKPDKVTVDEEDLKRLILNQEARLQSLDLDGGGSSSDDESDNENGADGVENTSSGKRKRSGDEDTTTAMPGSSKSKGKGKTSKAFDVDDIAKKYGLEDYDEEEEEDDDNRLSVAGLTYYSSNKDDPFLTKNEGDEEDEIELVPGDNLIAVGKVDGMFCNLEVYIYNEEEDNLFCHHDIMLPSFPLSLEWLGYDHIEKKPANFVAMGSMEPDIEVWDLDLIDAVEPVFVLAGAQKKSKKKKKKTSLNGHTDAVLDLAWNHNQQKILASASADFTVGIWDLEEGKMVTTIGHHQEKVQSIKWHPFESQTLLSGSFDHTVKVYDCRNADNAHKSWDMPGEVEKVLWNHHNPFYFLASTDTGNVVCFDIRQDAAVFTLDAHTEAVNGLTMSSSIPGCLVTCSADKILKVWDITNTQPHMVTKKNMKMGELQCAGGSPDSSLIFAVGGDKELRVLNLAKNTDVANYFNVSGHGLSEGGEGNDELKAQDMDNDEEAEADQEEEEKETTQTEEKETTQTEESKPKKKKNRKNKNKKPKK